MRATFNVPTLILPILSLLWPAAVLARPDFVFVDRTVDLVSDPAQDAKDTLDIDLADVDGDGDLDLFAVDGSASAAPFPNRLLINDGLGRFSDQSATRLPAGPANSTEVDFADIDGDGDLDAVVSNLGANQLLLNDGAGHFTDASGRLPQAAPPGPPGFAVPFPPFFVEVSAEARFVDIDGDRDPDVVIANENPFPTFGPRAGDQNRILVNDGSGQFSEGSSRLPVRLDQSSGFVAGDIDGDGDEDLIQIDIGENNVLINDGYGFFGDETATRLPANGSSSRKGVLADVDRDGDLDLFVANSRNEQNRLLVNDGRGHFTDVTATALPVRLDTTTDIDFVDLDGDGDLDAYVTNVGDFVGGHGFLGDTNIVLENDGRGRFTDIGFPRASERNGRSTNAEFGDVDGDHLPDLAVANSGGVSQPGLPPPDGADRLYLTRRCGSYPSTCLGVAIDQLESDIGALDPDPAAGQMTSNNRFLNQLRKSILQARTRVMERLLRRQRTRALAPLLIGIKVRADGVRFPRDWVLGTPATRIEAASELGINAAH